MAYVYLIRNVINGKGYVGQTEMSISRRWTGHKSSARCGSSLVLHAAMRKYGVENFTICEVLRCDSLLLNDLEAHYIKFYGTFCSSGHGYNMSEGGENPPNHKGAKRSEKTRARMSAAARNRPPMSPEIRAQISATKKANGDAPSPEAREKARVLSIGKPRAAHVIAAATAARLGVKKNAEELARRSATRKANTLARQEAS